MPCRGRVTDPPLQDLIMIELTINDKKIEVAANTTILEAARSVGIYIPTLCAYKGLTPIGACRVCVVELEGERKPVASCHVPAMKGMVVKTDTPRLWELRKMMVELILATHPLECPICDKGGECELQDITHAFGVKGLKYKLDNPKRTRVGANPFLYIDFQRCIQCVRCARYTEEVEGVKVFDYHGSGGYSFEMDRHLERDPEAESIAGVISVCPVGSLLNHPMKLHSIRPWELTKTQTTCPHCSDGCQLILNTAHEEIYRVTAPSETDFSQGHPCLRGRFGYGFVHHPSRLKTPLIKVDGVRKEVSWDYALTLASSKIKEIKESYGSEAIWGVPSPGLTNEGHLSFAFLFTAIGGKVALSDGVGNTTLSGVREVMGEGYGRSLSLIDEADLVIVIGADLTETNPFLANTVSRTARLKESKAVVINPRKVELSKSAWRWLAPKPGTEAALLTLIGKRVSERLGNAPNWIRGIDEEHLESVTGVSKKLVEEVSHAILKAERPCIVVGDDLSYSDNRYLGIAAANLLILSGRSDSEVSGVFPVLSESNSWGAVTIHKGAKEIGSLYKGIKEGKIKALYLSGEDLIGNRSSAWEEALRSLELLIVQDSNMTRTAEIAHVVLPTLTFAEAEGTYSDNTGILRSLKASLKPLIETKPGEEIITDLADKLGCSLEFQRFEGITHKSGSASPVNTVPVPTSPTIGQNKDYPFLLLTGKRLYGSYTLFEKCKPLWDASPEGILEINSQDAGKLHIKDGYKVKVTSETGTVEAKVSIKDTVMPGTVYLPIHPLNGSQKLISPDGGPCFVKIEAIQ